MLLEKEDSLRDVIEKISAIPECKLIYFEGNEEQLKAKLILSLSDLFTYIDERGSI